MRVIARIVLILLSHLSLMPLAGFAESLWSLREDKDPFTGKVIKSVATQDGAVRIRPNRVRDEWAALLSVPAFRADEEEMRVQVRGKRSRALLEVDEAHLNSTIVRDLLGGGVLVIEFPEVNGGSRRLLEIPLDGFSRPWFEIVKQMR